MVDETEKGWYISYINRDPEAMARQVNEGREERGRGKSDGGRSCFILLSSLYFSLH